MTVCLFFPAFDHSLQLDSFNLQQNIKRWNNMPFRGFSYYGLHGDIFSIDACFVLSGLVVLGSNGEFPLLSSVERVNLVDAVKKTLHRDRLLIAGAGDECLNFIFLYFYLTYVTHTATRTTIQQCKNMAAVGADAALVITPHFYKNAMTNDALFTYYSSVYNFRLSRVIIFYRSTDSTVLYV